MMVVGIGVLLAFQLLGEVLSYAVGGLVPWPVIGMALISMALILVGRTPSVSQFGQHTIATSNLFLANLGILFVPAGVGIIQHLDLVRDHGLAILATIIISTVATLVVTVGAFLGIKHLLGSKGRE
ncbi:CidA/LrgA family protein [Rhizobium sp. 16-449-1b]|uniref:CidA/LrgA family protein n=1 Tax=Rhizobium sp. 16-449-1b TaxID=2819989 RepID=UPI001ADD0492|nr:CidA/LrgA family protein [Rhizobium sp. 16-449-1b]MBO9197519.1 CidA/LrgA family protein [Rhizobium sp. 16-449-1b]